MEKELKVLIDYIKENKSRMEELIQERVNLANEKNKIDDKESIFYKEAESNYETKVQEYNSLNKIVESNINIKKKEITDKIREDMDKMEEISKLYGEIRRERETLEGAKAHEKWIKSTLLANTPNNAQIIAQAETRVKETELKLNLDINKAQFLTEKANIPKGKTAYEVYMDLQEKSKKIEEIDFTNFERVYNDLVYDSKKAEPKQVDPKQVDPKQVNPKQVNPKQVDPKQVDPKQVNPKQVDPKQVDPKQVDPKQVDPKQVNPKQVDPKQVDPKQIDPKQIDPNHIQEDGALFLKKIL